VSSSDISSWSDWSVNRHTVTLWKTIPSFAIEECKGDPAESNNENVIVQRGFGAKFDTVSIKASDGDTLQVTSALQMLWIFDKANLQDDVSAWSNVDLPLDTIEWLVSTDTVVIRDSSSSEEDAIASIDTSAESIEIATLWNAYTVDNGAKVELAPQTPSFSIDPQNASLFDVKVQFGANVTAAASASETNVDELEISMANNINVRSGTKRPGAWRVDAQRRNGQITFKKVFDTKAERDVYLDNAKQACILTISNGEVISSTDTNNAKYKLELKMPNVRYDEFDIPTGNDTIYEIEATIEIFDDSTEWYAIQALFENAKAWTYYTA